MDPSRSAAAFGRDAALLLSETLKAGKPVYSFSAALVPEGALVSDGPGIASIGAQAAELVNRVASGEKGEYEVLFPTPSS